MDGVKKEASGRLTKAILIVPGMGSNHCSGLVTTSLERLEGISDIKTNIANHHVEVMFDPALLQGTALQDAVERAGYEVDSLIEEKR